MRMLITRPEPDAEATRERLAALDIAAEIAPVMTRQTLQTNLPLTAGFTGIALTSINALRALDDMGALDKLRSVPTFAVGDRTAHEARQHGFDTVSAADGTLESLATLIALARPAGPVFYPAGKHLSGDLAHALAPRGIMVVTTPVYEMVAETVLPDSIRTDLAAGRFGAVLCYSRRTAEIFCALVADVIAPEARRQLPIICLSENVAQPLLEHRFSRVLLADHPSEEAMMSLALAFAREQTGS
jgi:uroporphyrinogen-III synthase